MPPENELQKIANQHLAADEPGTAPQTPPPPFNKNEHDPNSPLKQIRTYQGDVAEILESQNESLYSIRAKEQQAQQAAQQQVQTEAAQIQGVPESTTPGLKTISGQRVTPMPEDKSKEKSELLLLLLGSLVLILLGLAGAWYGYQTFLKQSLPPVIAVPDSHFIATQSSVTLDATTLTRETLLQALNDKVADTKDGEIRQVILRMGTTTENVLTTTTQFLQKLEVQAPGSLVRAFDPLFMFGSLGSSHFLIIKVTSFENAFPGMLMWEKTMGQDLGPLFATNQLLQNTGPTSVFKDVISKNKDVRALYAPTAPLASTTAPVILYSFFDNQKLIITDSFQTLQVVIDRLTQELLVH